MYFGYFEKFFIADRLALVTDSIFQDYPMQAGAALVFAGSLTMVDSVVGAGGSCYRRCAA